MSNTNININLPFAYIQNRGTNEVVPLERRITRKEAIAIVKNQRPPEDCDPKEWQSYQIDQLLKMNHQQWNSIADIVNAAEREFLGDRITYTKDYIEDEFIKAALEDSRIVTALETAGNTLMLDKINDYDATKIQTFPKGPYTPKPDKEIAKDILENYKKGLITADTAIDELSYLQLQ